MTLTLFRENAGELDCFALVCTHIFNISGEFIEVFFPTIYSIMVLVEEVWFYFFISYREMKVRLHFQFLSYGSAD